MSSTSPSPQEPQLAAVPEDAPSPAEDDQIPRKLFVAALVALVLAAVGFAIQTGRIGGYEQQIQGLEGAVAGLTDELVSTQQRVAVFERERQEIRQSVSRLRQDVLALDALVGADLTSQAPPATQEAEPGLEPLTPLP